MTNQKTRNSAGAIWREAIDAIRLSFHTLARIQFEAPWNDEGRSGC